MSNLFKVEMSATGDVGVKTLADASVQYSFNGRAPHWEGVKNPLNINCF